MSPTPPASAPTDAGDRRAASGGLVSRNVTIGRKRTSMRLEREMWDWLREVAAAHGLSIHRYCTMVDAGRPPMTSLTAAIRVEIARFYRDQAGRYAQALARLDQPLPQPSPVGGK